MLDAFVIDQLKKKKEREDWQPVPLTLEIPKLERHDEQLEREKQRREERGMRIMHF